MKNYARIVTKIRETPWLITPESLAVILEIVDARIKGDTLSDEELSARLQANHSRNGDSPGANAVGGVGILPIEGPIFGKANLMTEMSGATSLEAFKSDFRAMMNDSSINSILLQIDSPGGTSDMVQETGAEIAASKGIKPVYAIADGMAGSAAYWLMSQAPSGAYATPSGSVGSIGVYTVHEDRSVADAQAGKRFTYTSAGAFKTEGNPHEPLSEEGKQYRQEVVDELYSEFVNAVATGRNTDADNVMQNFGGGRMLTPAKALDAGMIDGVMPFENLVNTLVNQPRQVTVAIPSAVAAKITPAELALGGSRVLATFRAGEDGVFRMETADQEHSEPGGGGPRQGNLDDKDVAKGGPPNAIPPAKSDDAAIQGGWRRDPLPMDPSLPNAPHPNSKTQSSYKGGEEVMNPELLKLLGLEEDATDEQVSNAIQALVATSTEVAELRKAIAITDQEQTFAQQFPEVWSEHAALLNERREMRAEKFANSIGQFTRPDGDNFVKTDYGLSALALETVQTTHMKFAAGTANVEDFENAIKAITQGGMVDYSEQGSKLAGDPPAFSTSTTEGIAATRKLFAQKVSEVRKDKPEMSAQEALTEAARLYPDLAAAYQAAVPVG